MKKSHSKSAKKGQKSKDEDESNSDDIMEKFEQSLGEDDLGSFNSLHQKAAKHDLKGEKPKDKTIPQNT